MFKSILVVCIGNICRSPFAQAMLENYFKKNNLQVTVDSAGIAAMVDYPANDGTAKILGERGIDISHHAAKQVTQQLLSEFDLILTMEEDQTQYLCRKYPFVRGKVHLLGKWAEIEIIDPYQKPFDAFEHMAKQIDTALTGWQKQFWPVKTTVN